MSIGVQEQIKLLDETQYIPSFKDMLSQSAHSPLKAKGIDIFQINVGKLCNLTCKHCHVEAGPHRSEIMSKDILQKCLDYISHSNVSTVDITGGAPEMNPHIQWFIEEVFKLNRRLIIRSNLVILLEEAYAYLVDVFAKHKVEIVCSLPDFHGDMTNKMRGNDVFARSIEVLKILNGKGYGIKGSAMVLDLVHNPVGAYLPASQSALEEEYKTKLLENHAIHFNSLFCLVNMPMGRYLNFLLNSGNYGEYMELLVDSYNPLAVENVMCRSTISIGWDGVLYDCDFNQMLDIAVDDAYPRHINDFDFKKLGNREIKILNHCYGCTAGSGSSCQGSIDN